MKASNWIGRVNAPDPDPLQCYACQHPESGYRHMCRESIDPGEIVTPEQIARANHLEEQRGTRGWTESLGRITAHGPGDDAPTYDPAELVDLVNELGDHITARVERLTLAGRHRDVLWVVAAAVGAVERLATRPGSAGDALRELSELAHEVDERLAAAPLAAAASPAGSGTSPTGPAGVTHAAVPGPTGRRAWRPLRALRWPIAFAVGTAGFETLVMSLWLSLW